MTIKCAALMLCILCIGFFQVVGAEVPDLHQNDDTITNSIHIDGNPPGMKISLDGAEKGVVPPSGVLVIDRVPIGERIITAELTGYRSRELSIMVPDGLPAEIRITLDPIVTGIVTISSVPEGGDVYLDDVYRGISPLTLPSVEEGEHSILIRKEGYSDWKTTVQISSDSDSPISAELITNPSVTGTIGQEQPESSPKPSETSKKSGLIPGLAVIGILFGAAMVARQKK